MESRLKQTIDKLERDFDTLRPYTRQEYKNLINPVLEELDEAAKVFAYDHDRAPYIERRGTYDARSIVQSVPMESYPDPVLYILVCLQRVEAALYENVRSAPGEGEREERRTLMYRVGMAKAIKTIAAQLPEKTYMVWQFRRRMLNVIEDDLWRSMVSGRPAAPSDRDRAVLLADILHALSPLEMSEFGSPDELASWFISEGGDDAAKLCKKATA